jgi:apolipoprotein N-acyltransferase
VRPASSQLGWGAAAVLLSAAAAWHATGLDPWWPLAWLAPMPVLVFALHARASAAAVAAFAAWALGGLNTWPYLRGVLRVPMPVVLVSIIVPAVVFAGLVLLVRLLARGGRAVLAAVALPAGWTAFEFVVSRVSPHGTFGSLAYTQMDFLPIVQVASVAGTAGITFLLLLVPATIAVPTLPTCGPSRPRILGTTAAVVALALAYGGWRLAWDDVRRTPVNVGLAAADRPEQPLPVGTDEARALLAGYSRAITSPAFRGAEIVVLPETVVRTGADGLTALHGDLAGATDGPLLVVGADLLGPQEANVAVAFVPGSRDPALYSKQHLLPPFESRYQPGHDPTVLDTRWGSVGLAVCKDMDFPPLGRRYAALGVSLLLVPAWDFTADGWLHGRMAVLRGVEGGFAVARAARGGRLTISDDRGRVVADAASAGAPVVSLVGKLAVGPQATPYARFGDWFAWLACGLFAVAVAGAVRAGSAQEGVEP